MMTFFVTFACKCSFLVFFCFLFFLSQQAVKFLLLALFTSGMRTQLGFPDNSVTSSDFPGNRLLTGVSKADFFSSNFFQNFHCIAYSNTQELFFCSP